MGSLTILSNDKSTMVATTPSLLDDLSVSQPSLAKSSYRRPIGRHQGNRKVNIESSAEKFADSKGTPESLYKPVSEVKTSKRRNLELGTQAQTQSVPKLKDNFSPNFSDEFDKSEDGESPELRRQHNLDSSTLSTIVRDLQRRENRSCENQMLGSSY